MCIYNEKKQKCICAVCLYRLLHVVLGTTVLRTFQYIETTKKMDITLNKMPISFVISYLTDQMMPYQRFSINKIDLTHLTNGLC